MAPANHAAWLNTVNEPLSISQSEIPKPGHNEVLVRNYAVAINPIDWMQQYGPYPAGELPRILGNDIAGEIVELGDHVAAGLFSVGQRVLGHCTALNTDEAKHGGFQEFTVVPTVGCAPIPEETGFAEASVLPLGLSTAALGLFHKDLLGLRLPTDAQQKKKQEKEDASRRERGWTEETKAVLVWGASSSVGTAAVQLAVTAGYTVIATASPRNFELCEELGASRFFDHSSSGVVGDLVTAMREYECVGGFDAISTRETQLSVAQVLAHLGGGNMAVTLPASPEIPDSVKANMMIAAFVLSQDQALGKAIYNDFLPGALKSGMTKPAPRAEVVGHGVENFQRAVDRLREGVSGTKIVVTL